LKFVVKASCHLLSNPHSNFFGHCKIIFHLFLSIYHLKLGNYIIFYHLFQSTYYFKLVAKAFCHIYSNPHSTFNLVMTASLSSVPIHISPQIKSWHYPLSSLLIHIVPQMCRESILSHPFQSIYHFKLGHDNIPLHLFQSQSTSN
jgi:hypothetical protein